MTSDYFSNYFKNVFVRSIIFSFAFSNTNGSVQPAAFICPPPLNIAATSATFTYSLERSDVLNPFSVSLIKIETSTPSMSLPISTKPS